MTTNSPAGNGPVDRNVGRHTPGPWDVSHDGDHWPLVMGGGKIVANINPESFHGGVADLVEMPAEANARLISAAPDLLDALTELHAAMARYEGDSDGEPTSDHGRMMRKVRSALARATGLTPNAGDERTQVAGQSPDA